MLAVGLSLVAGLGFASAAILARVGPWSAENVECAVPTFGSRVWSNRIVGGHDRKPERSTKYVG